jgi:glycosyltransferase involved in cell wall biosynthesis
MSRVSVVIPTYQRPRLLERAIASVQAQTHPDVEFVVIPDETPREDYPSDPHAFWCAKGCHPRNEGLDRATGEWVMTLDDDDELEPDAVRLLLEAAEANDWDVAYGRSRVAGAGLLGSWPPRASGFVNGSVLWRASFGYRFDPGCWQRGQPADWDLWSRMLADGRRWGFVDAVVHHYYPAGVAPVCDPA